MKKTTDNLNLESFTEMKISDLATKETFANQQKQFNSLYNLSGISSILEKQSKLLNSFSVNSLIQEKTKLLGLSTFNSMLKEQSKFLNSFSVNSLIQEQTKLLGSSTLNSIIKEQSKLLNSLSVNSLVQEQTKLLGSSTFNSMLKEQSKFLNSFSVNSLVQEQTKLLGSSPLNSIIKEQSKLLNSLSVNSLVQEQTKLLGSSTLNSIIKEQSKLFNSSAGLLAQEQSKRLNASIINSVKLAPNLLSNLSSISSFLHSGLVHSGTIDNIEKSFSIKLIKDLESISLNDAIEIVQESFSNELKNTPQNWISFEGMIQLFFATILFIYAQNSSTKTEENLLNKIDFLENQVMEKIIQLIPEDDNGIFYIVKRPVNLRSDNNTEASLINILHPNQRVEMIKRNSKWIYVKYFDYIDGIPRTGWVYKKYLKIEG